jgi:anti-sigma B factor antagonist
MTAGFTARVSAEKGLRTAPVVTVDGEIDLATAGQFDQALQAAAGNALRVTVDLTGVTYLDSAAIRVLFEHAARVRLVLVRPADGIVTPLVTLCGLDRVVTVRDAGTWRRS